ncbi:MAG TPA: hypothetical protein P5204_00100 [Kiritimatiellia bacterium]|nr:hypothetical protein [Kiritimatiellia bacterium]
MKTTVIYGPAGSGKTVLAQSLHRTLGWRALNFGKKPGIVEDDLPGLTKARLGGMMKRAISKGLSHLVVVANERPDDKALALADFVVETRSNKEKK